MTDEQFACQSPCHGISVQHGLPLTHSQRLQSVPHGVSEIESLAYVFLQRVSLHHFLLHPHRLGEHELQALQVGVAERECKQFAPHAVVAEKPVFEHLGIARTDVVVVERVEEKCVENDEPAVAEHSYLVLQSPEVHSGLASHRCVDHGEQCRWDVDEVDAALECRCGESSEVCHHASSEVDEARVSRGSSLLQTAPHV